MMIFRPTVLFPCLLAFISSPLFAAPTSSNASEAASAPASSENPTEAPTPPLKKSEISPRKDKSKSEQGLDEEERDLTPN